MFSMRITWRTLYMIVANKHNAHIISRTINRGQRYTYTIITRFMDQVQIVLYTEPDWVEYRSLIPKHSHIYICLSYHRLPPANWIIQNVPVPTLLGHKSKNIKERTTRGSLAESALIIFTNRFLALKNVCSFAHPSHYPACWMCAIVKSVDCCVRVKTFDVQRSCWRHLLLWSTTRAPMMFVTNSPPHDKTNFMRQSLWETCADVHHGYIVCILHGDPHSLD